jgi:hypothetical protein
MVKQICNECGRAVASGAGLEIGRNTHFLQKKKGQANFFISLTLTYFFQKWLFFFHGMVNIICC